MLELVENLSEPDLPQRKEANLLVNGILELGWLRPLTDVSWRTSKQAKTKYEHCIQMDANKVGLTES